jgi:hypothetical protein
MRVVINGLDFFSLKNATEHFKCSLSYLKKNYTITPYYEKGHWREVDLEFIKQVAITRYGSRKCLIA